MPTRQYYQEQARILFDMAKRMSAKRDADALIERANEYQMLAEALPDDAPETPPPTVGTVVQPMQQQQQKQSDEDK